MTLRTLDLAIIVAYLIGNTLFGLSFRKRQRSIKDYFLADKHIPWWGISLSIVAAETSTLTVIGVPGLAFGGNLGFLQLVFGYLLGRIVISALFLPQYFKGELFTAYQLIQRRFGPRLYLLTASLFLVIRAVAEGVRVFAIAIVVGVAMGRGDLFSITAIAILTVIYTYQGGMEASIWTDVAQTSACFLGAVFAAFFLVHQIDGGWPQAMATASAANKFNLFDFSFDLSKTYTFWAGLIGGAFLTTASHGTDQLLVQRLLSSRSQTSARVALISSWFVVFVQFSLFLLVGVLLFVYYGQNAPAEAFKSTDRIFPTYIVQSLPTPVTGLFLGAILAAAMSSLSAALNSLASTTIIDLYLRWKPQTPERSRLFLSRSSTAIWGVALWALAIYSSRASQVVVERGLALASVAYGALLGVFLLGLLSRRATESGAMLGMLAGFAANVYIWMWGDQLYAWSGLRIAWTWYVSIGAITTFIVGYLSSFFFTREANAGSSNA